MKEVKKEEAEWDKKKIILFVIAALILLGIGFQLRTMTLGQTAEVSEPEISSTNEDVKGVSSKNPNIKKDIQNQINNLKAEAENINIVDIASSSPQVQKVINDLKSLQDLPSNQLRQACEKVCSGL